MRKVILILCVAVFLSTGLHAAESALPDIRNKIHEESKEIRGLMKTTKDPVFISSMWDSCLVATTQLDAYFSMLRIYNTIDNKALSKDAVDVLTGWLATIRQTDDLNIKTLSDISQAVDRDTQARMTKLKGLFEELNREIESEETKLSVIKESLSLR